ncbi:MAG: hypothetical protein AB3A66_02270 [Nodularia sp. CChRGM 3473]
MKTSLFFVACAAFIVAGSADLDQNLLGNYPHNSADINSVIAVNKRNFSSSSDYQESSVSLSRANLRQPHILSINTSGSRLQGNITYNGKVIQQIRDKRAYVNLSPYLSLGKHTVKISTRYSPASSSVSVEFRGPGINVTQQTSGSGILNYTLNVNVN